MTNSDAPASPGAATATHSDFERVHDFGSILSDGAPLGHDFLLKNPSSRPLRLLKGFAGKTCCSSVGALPEVVAPGGVAAIPVRFVTAGVSGPIHLDFGVTTDSADRPVERYTVRGTLVEGCEVVELDRTRPGPVVGEPCEKRYRLIERRLAGQSTSAPSLIAGPGCRAALLRSDPDRRLADGVVESSREVMVNLSAVDAPGPKSTTFTLRWDDGRSEKVQRVDWQVSPTIRVVPSVVVMADADRSKPVRVAIRSARTPFRVLDVRGRGVAGHRVVAGSGEVEQTLEVRFTPGAFDAATSTLDILTDDRLNPKLSLRILTPR